MLNAFYYDSMSAKDLCIQMQSPVTFSGVQPKEKTISVPGRNGDLHSSEHAYANKTAEAICFVLQENVQQVLDQIVKWTLLNPGYKRLELEDDPEYYHMARVTNGPEIQIRMKLLAPFTIRFDCKPQKFRKDGEYPRIFSEPSVLYNGAFPSLPLITVYGSGEGELQIGRYTVKLLSIDESLTLDSDTQNAYKETQNKNNTVFAPQFPRLEPGENEIAWQGGIQKIKIIPRWWTL